MTFPTNAIFRNLKVKREILIALLLFMGSSASAQVNYVLNPDLEEYTRCDHQYDQIGFAKYWSSIDTVNVGTSYCIPEYCNTCATGSSVGVPENQAGWQQPHSGNGYALARVTVIDTFGNGGIRDYLQGRLFKNLTAGKNYCVSFYVSLTECSHHAIKELGAYLDNGSIDTVRNCSIAQTRYVPQVVNTAGILSDTANWVRIEGSFIANGTERFITIGNFKDNAHTTYAATPINNFQGSCQGTYYYIDDVSVMESDLSADAGPDRHIGNGDSTYIGRPAETGLECSWNVLGNTMVIGTGGGIWVKPSATTCYEVTQSLCGVSKKDTVRVEVWGVGVASINGKSGQGYTLSPNPNNGAFELSQSFPVDESAKAEVFDMLGRKVYDAMLQFRDGKAGMQVNGLATGLYVLKIGDGFVRPLRFEIQ